MTTSKKPTQLDQTWIAALPQWSRSARSEAIGNVSFSSGAAWATVDIVLHRAGARLPSALLGDRLALQAAMACLKLEGRQDSVLEIRDAVCLARAGDAPGPAGEMFNGWRKLARVNLGSPKWRDQVLTLLPANVVRDLPNLALQDQPPLSQAAQVLSDMLQKFPREETAAFMLAEATLGRALGWDRAMPVLARHLKRGDVRALAQGADDGALRVHRAGIEACDRTLGMIADLTRRAEVLHAVAPKLRAKGAADAVALFLSHDAVSPSVMLSPMIKGTSFAMTDRAARRLCDRLVDLGAVRELTGRATFRLYGV